MNSSTVLSIFEEILRVPRESGHEEKIVAWLCEWAARHGLEHRTDKVGNVLIVKPADKGCEDRPTVVLQGHSDMVCEKNKGVDHDFLKDPIKYEIEDGWMIARDTTLGADCGIGVASALAALIDPEIKSGRIEALFTVSEETGLDGADNIKPGFISGKLLINLDSEDEGEMFVGCAGGVDTVAEFRHASRKVASHRRASRFGFSGCLGGHSGDDIDKERANAVQLLARFLYRALPYDIDLCSIEGGNKRNAIAREASAVIAFNAGDEDEVVALFNQVLSEVKAEYAVSDPGIRGFAEPVSLPAAAIDAGTARRLISVLNCAPHGVLAMSTAMRGMVETSTNLASVKMLPGNVIRVATNQRSDDNTARDWAAERVEAAFLLAGASVEHQSPYPGWKPRMDSPLLDATVASYRRCFGADPIVRSIHAGLECGLFLEKYPDLDMISFGPTLRGVHAPGERLSLASLDKFVKHLTDLLNNIR